MVSGLYRLTDERLWPYFSRSAHTVGDDRRVSSGTLFSQPPKAAIAGLTDDRNQIKLARSTDAAVPLAKIGVKP